MYWRDTLQQQQQQQRQHLCAGQLCPRCYWCSSSVRLTTRLLTPGRSASD